MLKIGEIVATKKDNVIRFTKRIIDQLPNPEKRIEYVDESLATFRLRVSPLGHKTFYLLKRHNATLHRVKLGVYPDLPPEQARVKATKMLADFAQGFTPTASEKARSAATVTLREALTTYLEKNKRIKDSTKYDYQKKIERVFSKELEKPLASLTRDRIFKIHTEYSKQSASVSDSAMRYLRAVFNFAEGEYSNIDGSSLFPENPTRELSRLKAWHKPTRRKTLIRRSQLPSWFKAVADLPELYPTAQAPIVRDLFFTLILTGLRRNEGARLRVEDVNIADRLIVIRETKNGESLELPIGEYLAELLARRVRQAANGWLFPNRVGNGPIKTYTKAHAAVKEASGVEFIAHDLRRTFITIAESQDLSRYTLKRLLNHSEGDDVTGGYIVLDTERLRAPMEAIESQILKLAGVTSSAKVIKIGNRENG